MYNTDPTTGPIYEPKATDPSTYPIISSYLFGYKIPIIAYTAGCTQAFPIPYTTLEDIEIIINNLFEVKKGKLPNPNIEKVRITNPIQI